MNKQQKDKLVASIHQEIANLGKELPALEQLTKPVPPDNAIGRLTRMEAINNKSINEANLANAKARMARLQHALEMSDDPDFGICIQCDEPIPFKRLMVQPDSGLCVRCAEKVNG